MNFIQTLLFFLCIVSQTVPVYGTECYGDLSTPSYPLNQSAGRPVGQSPYFANQDADCATLPADTTTALTNFAVIKKEPMSPPVANGQNIWFYTNHLKIESYAWKAVHENRNKEK